MLFWLILWWVYYMWWMLLQVQADVTFVLDGGP